MPYNPSLPADHAQVVSSELRNQFNGLKDLIDAQAAQLAQLAPLVPVLTRDSSGVWTLVYGQTPPPLWLVWARTEVQPVWQYWHEVSFADFPLGDGDLMPPGSWWQVKIAGENAAGDPGTAFSNVVSFGNVPA